MYTFKDIELSDREIITSYTIPTNRRNCDLSFSNLCSWRFLYDTQFAIIEDLLVFKFWASGELAYMMPVGEGNVKKVIRILIEDAKKEGQPFVMLGVCEEMKKKLDEIAPGKFNFVSNRDYSDYLYERTDLATLKGKKFQSKRNFVNRFKKNFKYEYKPITLGRIDECLELEAKWCIVNDCNKHDGTENERKALTYALKNFKELGLTGGILYADGEIVAFTFGMPINYDTFGVHVEKADTQIEGAYAMINREFAKQIPEQFKYINREEDLGIEGLRKAKLSYQPSIILNKYMASLAVDSVETIDW